MTQCDWGKINLWAHEQAANWNRGTAPTSEWLAVFSVTGQVIQTSQSIQIQ